MQKPFVVAAVGAGGKTTLLRHLAGEGQRLGLKTLVLTTTHMLRPKNYGILNNDGAAVQQALQEKGLAVVGLPGEEGKMTFCGAAFYAQICPWADLILVEADGARRKPVKVPAAYEPVLPANVQLILCLESLGALGQSWTEICLRQTEAKRLLVEHGDFIPEDAAPLTAEMLALFLQEGYLVPLRRAWPCAKLVPVLTHADEPVLAKQGQKILDLLQEKQGWLLGKMTESPYESLF